MPLDLYEIAWESVDGRRTAKNLLRLKTALAKSVPRKTDGQSLIATWNIRELGRGQNERRRTDEALAYISEILSRFDVVAVQEVRNELGDFKSIMRMLGPSFAHLLTDITVGTRGNHERIAFIYDRTRVRFG